MAFAVASTLERRLGRGNGREGRMWLPWEGRYKDSSSLERLPVTEYLSHANRVRGQNDSQMDD